MPDDQSHGDDDDRAGEREIDADTEMILDYLSNKLDRSDAEALEQRAHVDKDFRYKLADVVLLKGLVMLALDRNPEPETRECRRTQALFLDYLRGRTNAAKTAQLSRHIDECFECELAFERFESREAKKGERGGWGGFWRRFELPGRRLLVASLVVSALAAGAFGVVGMLTSSSRHLSAARPEASGGLARPASTLQDKDAVLAAIEQVRANHPEIAENARFAALTHEVLDDAQTPEERGRRYLELGADYGARVEPLMWVLAANETLSTAREHAYQAIDLSTCVKASLLAATRREITQRSPGVFLLLQTAIRNLDGELRQRLRTLFEPDADEDPVWRVQILRGVYGSMKDDPVVQRRMTEALASPTERIRAHAVHGAAAAEHPSALPVAVGLLAASDRTARTIAALVIIRHGHKSDFERVMALDWSNDPAVAKAIEIRAGRDGIARPKQP